MGAEHVTRLAVRRRRGNLAGLAAISLAVGVAFVGIGTTKPISPTAAAPLGSVGATGEPGQTVVVAEVGGQQWVMHPDGSITQQRRHPVAPASATLPPADGGQYYAYATASTVFTGSPGDGASTGFSSAAVSTDGTRFPARDELGQPLHGLLPRGTTGFGMTALSNRTQGAPAVSVAQATSPSRDGIDSRSNVASAPTNHRDAITAVGGNVESHTTRHSACYSKGRVVEANSEVAGGDLLPGVVPLPAYDPAGAVYLAGVNGLASSQSQVDLQPSELVDDDGDSTPADGTMVVSRAKVRVPTITLFPGTVYAVQVRFLAPIEAIAQAGGTPGSARAHIYGLLLDQERPVLAVTAYFYTEYFTGRYFQTEHGISFTLGNGALLEIGVNHLRQAAGGRTAQAEVDAVRLRLPDALGRPDLHEAPDLLYTFTGYDSGLQKILDALNKGFTLLPIPRLGLPGGGNELRIGHLEAAVSVPFGGVSCRPDADYVFGINDEDKVYPPG